MAASWSGILTLAALLLAGPLAWLLHAVAKRRRQRLRQGGGEAAAAAEGCEGAVEEPYVKQREEVSGSDYLLGLLGYAIGIGNLWRFPYLVGKWGGGAFVLAYLVCLVFVAVPAYVIEMVMGQYTRRSTVECFRTIHPRWTGLGWGQVVMLLFVIPYYNVLLAYACIYIFGSLSDPLPWVGDSASYWNNNVLNNYGGSYEGAGFGGIQWNLALALFVVWLILFLSVAFGKSILAKVTWVTVVGPVIMLLVLLVRSLTLAGARDGVEFYIGKFDGAVLGDLDMWAAACGQILFSLSPGMGTAITLSSYTRPKEDVVKTCLIVSVCNSAFSLVGGIAIFSIVGNIAYNINEAGGSTTVAEQARAGPGLAFIAIAKGMTTFGDGTNTMSVLFFMVLLTLGLDSTFAWLETFIGYIEDAVGTTRVAIARWKIVLAVCVFFFLGGLPYCTRMGNELLDTMDHYVAGYYLLLGVALEAILFSFSFTWRRLALAVRRATLGNSATPLGRVVRPELFWRFCLGFTLPATSLFLFVYILLSDLRSAYEGYPDWVQGIGWFGLLILLVITPAGAIVHWKGESSLPSMEEEEASLKSSLGLLLEQQKISSETSKEADPDPARVEAAAAESTATAASEQSGSCTVTV